MEIKYLEYIDCSTLCFYIRGKDQYCHCGNISIKSDNDKAYPFLIEIDSKSPDWRMELAHEIGHILLGYRTSNYSRKRLRIEILAWRIARSIIKKKYWNEDRAIYCFSTYLKDAIPGRYDLSKIKIMPWNGEFKKKLEDK